MTHSQENGEKLQNTLILETKCKIIWTDIFFLQKSGFVTFLHLEQANLLQKSRKTNGGKYVNFCHGQREGGRDRGTGANLKDQRCWSNKQWFNMDAPWLKMAKMMDNGIVRGWWLMDGCSSRNLTKLRVLIRLWKLNNISTAAYTARVSDKILK